MAIGLRGGGLDKQAEKATQGRSEGSREGTGGFDYAHEVVGLLGQVVRDCSQSKRKTVLNRTGSETTCYG